MKSFARSWRPTARIRVPAEPPSSPSIARQIPIRSSRDVGRLFLGVDLTCCQCHDHPLIDGYKQSYYYGLFAFLNRTVLVTDPTAGAVLGEKAEGDVHFTSVFKKKVIRQTGPRVLDGPPLHRTKHFGRTGVPDPSRQGRKGSSRAGFQPPQPVGCQYRFQRRARVLPRTSSTASGPCSWAGESSTRSTCTTLTTRRHTPNCSTCSRVSSSR